MNVLIVEDEFHTANLLKDIIEEDQEFIVIKKVETVMDAVQYIGKYQNNLDLLFFDIQLTDGKSFEIFKHVDIITPVIFCTAYDEYTLKAIKSNGIDYILKPFEKEEIHQALSKFKQIIQKIQSKLTIPVQFNLDPPTRYQENFLSQFREKSVVINVDEIAVFTVENDIIYLITFKGQKLPVFKKLEYIESVCDPTKFFRINRSMLVNRKAVTSFEPYFNRKIVLQLTVNPSEKAIVSRLKVTAFQKWLEGY